MEERERKGCERESKKEKGIIGRHREKREKEREEGGEGERERKREKKMREKYEDKK